MAVPCSGRQIVFTVGTDRVACRTKDISINNEPIDISDDDDNGFRTLLQDDPQTRSIDMSVEGVLKTSNQHLLTTAIDGGITFQDATLLFPDVGTITGDFWFGSLTLGAPYNDAVTFSGTFMSTGEFTFVEASS